MIDLLFTYFAMHSVAFASRGMFLAHEVSLGIHASATVFPGVVADDFEDAQGMPRLGPDVAVVANGNECL